MSFATDLRQAAGQATGYEELPTCVKAVYSPREWLWLSDAQKAGLVQLETEPEHTEP